MLVSRRFGYLSCWIDRVSHHVDHFHHKSLSTTIFKVESPELEDLKCTFKISEAASEIADIRDNFVMSSISA